MVQERKNRLMAYRVEMGLKVQREVSTRAAAAYLANYGVPMHVSMRVLSTPNKRTGSLEGQEPLWFDIVRASGMTYGG
ncbi:hypothetical protein KY495_05845 [Massilia sp. PAMC28688]|uniref:hypothetical protein n=1 Tax=Massilia sp. PAMC28688 TaxID=2861283 RepID=UPI001C63B6FE|nr:hypothetical protein [Massilia sp. PAMC28688]QYF94711.1 hypothetical protein KY495_05845 [Massilia sp. PAMC28688]